MNSVLRGNLKVLPECRGLLTAPRAYGKARAALDSLWQGSHQAKRIWRPKHFAAGANLRNIHGQA